MVRSNEGDEASDRESGLVLLVDTRDTGPEEDGGGCRKRSGSESSLARKFPPSSELTHHRGKRERQHVVHELVLHISHFKHLGCWLVWEKGCNLLRGVRERVLHVSSAAVNARSKRFTSRARAPQTVTRERLQELKPFTYFAKVFLLFRGFLGMN